MVPIGPEPFRSLFTYEGTIRQHGVYRGRSRDTASFFVIDGELLRLRAIFEAWLRSENFDAGGRQKQSLERLWQDWAPFWVPGNAPKIPVKLFAASPRAAAIPCEDMESEPPSRYSSEQERLFGGRF